MEILSDEELERQLKSSGEGVKQIQRSGRFTATAIESVMLYRMVRELKMLRAVSRAHYENFSEMRYYLPVEETEKIASYLRFLDTEYAGLKAEPVPVMNGLVLGWKAEG